jgi:hypothetical protein
MVYKNMDGFQLTEYRIYWKVLLNMVMNFQVLLEEIFIYHLIDHKLFKNDSDLWSYIYLYSCAL